MNFNRPTSWLFLVLATIHVIHAAHPYDVIVQDLKIFINRKDEFFVKGMAYEPVPLGRGSMDSNQQGGTGFCSARLTPFNEWLSACYDSDYMNGAPSTPDRQPPGPDGGWFEALWDRDFPILKSMGVNTLRTYNANPTTALYINKYKAIDTAITASNITGAQHRPFLDKAHEYGFKVIFPIMSDESTFSSATDDQVDRWIKTMIEEVGDHPALLMWVMGNELDLASRPDLVTFLNTKMDLIRDYTYQTWGRILPVSTAVVDLPHSYDDLAASLNVDLFISNAGYRGTSFTNLWSGDASQGFSGWKALSTQHNIPLLIGEMGFPNTNNDVNGEIPDWFNQQWKDLVQHKQDGCIGGVFFEYSDEPLKADPLQKTMGVVKFEVNTVDGVTSTTTDAWIPDTATQKDIIFDAVSKGTFEGTEWNMNSDIWTLLGIEKATLNLTDIEEPTTTTGATTSFPSTTTTTSFATTTDDGATSSSASIFGTVSAALMAVMVAIALL